MANQESGAVRAPDDYQAKYMASGALYHDKIRAPRGYHLLFLLPLLIILVTSAVAASHVGAMALIGPMLSTIMLLAVWLLFSVLRISVSNEQVYVQYGLFGPKIAVRDIERVEAVDYDWKQYGGWGIRYGRDGSVAYNMLGDGGRAVRIVYKKGDKSKTVLVASHDPDRLAAAIQEARARVVTGARIELPAEAPAEVTDEIAREAAAEVEAAAEGAQDEPQRRA